LDEVSGKKGQAKSPRGERVIPVPPKRSLADLSRWYARENDGVNQSWIAKTKRENLYRYVFAKRNAARIPDAPQHGTMIDIRSHDAKLQGGLYPISQRPVMERNAQLLDARRMKRRIFINRLSPVR
jgi:hypothetical protein